MEVHIGKIAFRGIAIGKIKVIQRSVQPIRQTRVEDTDKEIQRFRQAMDVAKQQLSDLYEKALKQLGKTNAAIYEMHQMILEDEEYKNLVEQLITTKGINAEYAIVITRDKFVKIFTSMEDEYMSGRAADIRDISERVINIMEGRKNEDLVRILEPAIILAEDLTPSETLQLEKDKVLAFVTMHGSVNSHTAILARSMNIPALVSTDIAPDRLLDGKMAIVDGISGKLYIEPEEELLCEMTQKLEVLNAEQALLQDLKGKENITLDGQRVMVCANIGNIEDLAAVIENDAGGIGLFRSEFLYLEKENYPSEEEQFIAYKTVAKRMSGKRVIIRTLDIGADKKADYFKIEEEENPALGYRGIRISLNEPNIFKTQLRAILRAGIYGKLAIMYPMIISLEEIKQIKAIVKEVEGELEREKIPYAKDIEQGIMIETPAAVMISDLLAKEVDFFSIGTNDLTQYTLAIDRGNQKLNTYYHSHHKAILRMIQMVIKNAHENGIWVGICGELSSDLELTETFLALGIDELSVSPANLLPLRKKVRELNINESKEKILRELTF